MKFKETVENQYEIAVISENQEFFQILNSLLKHEFKNFEKLLQEQKLEFDIEKLKNLQKLKHFLVENGVVKNSEFVKSKNENYLKSRSRTLPIYWISINQELKQILELDKKDDKNKKKSKKGEHVINNDVIEVYNKIIDEFLSEKFNKFFSEIENELSFLSQLKKDYNKDNVPSTGFISQDNKLAIREEMKAFMEEPYFDANALMYGFFIQNLVTSSVKHMIELWNNRERGSSFTRHVKLCTEQIRLQEIFVDKIAYNKWIEQGGNILKFERAKNDVDNMFDLLFEKLKLWVTELKNVPSLSVYLYN